MISSVTEMTYRLDNLNSEQRRISYQMSTGKKLDNGSDDAAVFTREVYINDKIRVYDGLERQLEKTTAQNNNSDAVIADIKELLDYVKAEVIKGLNAGTDISAREGIASNLEGVRDNLFMFANTETEGEYLFTGSDTTIKPFSKDPTTGEISYNGDAQLRRIAVEYNEYRDRGVTGFDMMMYSTGEYNTGDTMSFTASERIIDENGLEWKPNGTTTRLYKYDDEGNQTTEYLRLAAPTGTPSTWTTQDPIGTYFDDNLGGPLTEAGKAFTPKHLIFDDLDNMINALREKDSAGNVVTEDVARDLLSVELDKMGDSFDAVNIAHAKLGGRNKVFEMATENISAKITHYDILQIEVSSADVTKVAIEAKALELTYTALYSTINRMNELSLVNFIR